MFETLKALNPDPILGLLAAYRQDTNPRKVDLGVGVCPSIGVRNGSTFDRLKNLVVNSAIGKMRFGSFIPTTKGLLNGEQRNLGQLL